MVDPRANTRLSEATPDPFLGQEFDGYRIESVLGRGGMGSVYRATQHSLGRSVALKILAADLVRDPQFAGRFKREADALSRLSHPNVVTVIDRGEVDGRPYLVMEYVEGPNLRDLLRGGPIEPAAALGIVNSVLLALQHAHERGIIHRDIKPENVLLTLGDVVKVADFGLSRLLGPVDTTRLTRTHLVLGTYEYMSPEQREKSREADERSDLYATGVVLYEMLTGELPIGRFELPSQRRPGTCDGRIDRLIERTLDKDPDRRYQRASEMAVAVSTILERPAGPGSATPSPEPARGSTEAASPRKSSLVQPIRQEYHLDNLATIDHVLGTACYALGFLSLFGARFTLWFGAPFFVFFVAGWYLRETSDQLRKYDTGARTSQAVISILAAFTGILIPLSIYSLWTLFSHRGRTYYEARGRGLDPRSAARQTERLLADSFLYDETAPDPEAPPSPSTGSPSPSPRPPPATPPRPSQIPVRSMVTSEVERKGKRRKRCSPFLALGWLGLIAGVVMYGMTVEGVLPGGYRWMKVPVVAAFGGFGMAFLHSISSRRVCGWFTALLGLGLTIAGLMASGLARLF